MSSRQSFQFQVKTGAKNAPPTGRIGDDRFEKSEQMLYGFDSSDDDLFIIDLRISGRLVMMPSTPISIRRCIAEGESGAHTNTWIPS